MNSIKLLNYKSLANFIVKNKNKVKRMKKRTCRFYLKEIACILNSKKQQNRLEITSNEASFSSFSFFLGKNPLS